jgi:virginiamycin B lyase
MRYQMTRTKRVSLALVFAAACLAQSGEPLRPGVKTPGVQIPLAKLVPSATFNLGKASDWIAIDKDIWVSIKPRNVVSRIDPRANKVVQVIGGFDKPCSGLAVGFDSLWVPNCGNQTLSRVDLNTGKISKVIPVGIADSEGGLATGAGSVWLLSSKKSVLTRIDPVSNSITANIDLPEGCVSAAFGFESVWVSCTKRNALVRVDAKTNSILSTIAVGPGPRFLSVGEGSVWTLNQGDGSITRISPDSNKVEATIEVGIPGEGGDIAVGEGSVWATAMGIPVSRIDPKTNQVAQQFVGDGGDAIRAGNGMVWLSNYKTGIEWRLDPATIAAAKP